MLVNDFDGLPLLSALVSHDAMGRASFHTPGHKCSGFIPEKLLKLDYTELPDTDALYEASGAILGSEKMLSRIFGAGRSLISAGGCTLAIQAMLRLAAARGGKLLCARNAHRSAVNTCALLGIDPVWLYPDCTGSFTGRIAPEDVRSAFEENKDITACYITSPDYYGELCDIRSIAEICKSYGAWLLVDNAHGSHLAFLREDRHPLHLGADMTACSLHKTLPVLTGGALLNLRDAALADDAKAAMSLFGSTSPSYPVMCSIELCAAWLEGSGSEELAAAEKKVAALKQLAADKGIRMPAGPCDPLRLTLCTASKGLAGKAQQKWFEDRGIDCEFCDGENAVMIITPFNSDEDLERIRSAIEEMPDGSDISVVRNTTGRPVKVMPLRDAVLSPSEWVPVGLSVGRTAADTACPCPPGVPVLMPGEMIDEDIAAALINQGTEMVKVVRP